MESFEHIGNNNSIIYDYIDNELDEYKMEQIDYHLDNCASCRESVERIRDIESKFSSFALSPEFLEEKKEGIRYSISQESNESGLKSILLNKKAALILSGGLTLSAFVAVSIGAVNIFSQKSQGIEQIIPASNPDFAIDNIYKTGKETFDYHIQEIEKMGYKVVENDKEIVIVKK